MKSKFKIMGVSSDMFKDMDWYIPKRNVVYVNIAQIDPEEEKKDLEFFRKNLFAAVNCNPCGEIELPLGDPDPIPFDPQLEQMCKDHDDYFWPHKKGCPLCGSDAYVGANIVECCMESCQNFVYKPGM